MMRVLTAITGCRADYGIFRPVLKEIDYRKDLDLKLIVTGMHLVSEYGMTDNDIEEDGFHPAEKVDILLKNDSGAAMAKTTALCLLGVIQALERIKPHILLVLGDRGEMLAGAIAAAHMGIVVAHIHGGELSGSIDGSIRHAITKFAHLHFPVTSDAARCLRASGEEENRIIQIGVPGLDDAGMGFEVTRAELSKNLGFALTEDYAIVVFHPVVGEEEASGRHFEDILIALSELELTGITFTPNADAGHNTLKRILDQYKAHEGYQSKMHVIPHLPRRLYLGLLANAAVMIGNSSSGIIEAPYFGLPVVNVGNRQRGRLRSYNVIDVKSDEDIRIKEAVLQALKKRDYFRANRGKEDIYQGGAGKKVASVLAKIPIDGWLLNKNFDFK